jgi:hypothetical protein
VVRALCLGLVVSALLVAGCGTSSGSSQSNPLSTELSYFAPDSPLVVNVSTQPNSAQAKKEHGLVSRTPLLAFGESGLFAKLSQLGIDYNKDVRPLFGNPIVAGIVQAPASGTPAQFLAVWITKDAKALDGLFNKISPGATQQGSHDGAKLYRLGQVAVAIDGPTVMIGDSTQELSAALDRHAGNSGITTSDYQTAVAGLPPDS